MKNEDALSDGDKKKSKPPLDYLKINLDLPLLETDFPQHLSSVLGADDRIVISWQLTQLHLINRDHYTVK